MRLIDADALIKQAGKLWSEMPDGEELSKELMKAINHAPTVGGWISVKDRLPDGEDCYLAYNRYGWDIMAYDPNEGVWLSMGHRVADGEITHWMPLPAEPPEEVQE